MPKFSKSHCELATCEDHPRSGSYSPGYDMQGDFGSVTREINMRESESKGVTDQEPEKPCVSKGESGSMLIASFLKKGRKIPNRRKHKQKYEMDARKISSNLLKKKGNGSASSGQNYSPEVDNKDPDGEGKAKRIRKSRKKRKTGKVELDEALCLQRRTRYLLIKMKLEQNLIDAYSAEGWKGQSREKIRPEKELQRARKQILKCKLGIRDAIHQLDLLSSVGSIEEKVIAPDGSVHHEHIFCAKCRLREAFLDNDIILCDGTCNRAFHQKCLDPPLDTASIPPGDQGWFCKFCVCKMDIIESTNAHIGTHFPVDSKWQDIFKEEASLPNDSGALLNTEEDWPSDDSEDGDYNPERRENSSSISGVASGGDDGESSSTSLSWSSDGVAFSSGSGRLELQSETGHVVGSRVDSGETSNEEIVCGPRQRRAVDYRKLHDEMFGKDALLHEQISEDEDWGPSSKRRRKRESDAASTLVTLCESDKRDPNVETTEEGERLSLEDKVRRPIFRLPRDAVEKLRQVFAKNELPSKSVKENLSKELGVEPEKVSKWFKNARYIALKSRKMESTKQPQGFTGFFEDSGPEPVKETNAETDALGDAGKETNAETDAPKDTLIETISPKSKDSTKNQKKISSCTSQKKSREATVTFPPLTKKDRAPNELSDDISLKKLLEEKKKRENKTAEETTAYHDEFKAVMERLCRTQNRIQNMKQRLSRFRTLKGRKKLGKSSSLLEEGSLMYVPIAEVREKRV